MCKLVNIPSSPGSLDLRVPAYTANIRLSRLKEQSAVCKVSSRDTGNRCWRGIDQNSSESKAKFVKRERSDTEV